MTEEEFADLSAAQALGALSPADEARFHAALAEHPEWAAQARMDAETGAVLADAVAEVAPPPAVRAALLARIAAPEPEPESVRVPEPVREPEPATAAASDAATPDGSTPSRVPTGRAARRWFALAASLVLLLAVGSAAVWIGRGLTTPPAVVALERIDASADAQTASAPIGSDGQATLHWSQATGQAVLVSDGLPALASDQTYQLWFVRDGAPVSAGLFTADGGAATALLAGSMSAGDTVAVTIEPSGGSDAPTSTPFVAITT